jgi:hypothetical protein
VKNPECFGCPALVSECRTCAVRQECFVEQRSKHPVFLLPRPRPAKQDRQESAVIQLLGGMEHGESDEAARKASD